MLSPNQKARIRDVVIACIGPGSDPAQPDGIPEIDPARIYWAPTGQPSSTEPYVVLTELGADDQGLEGDTLYRRVLLAQVDTIVIPATPSSELYDIDIAGDLVASADGTGLSQAELRDALIADLNAADVGVTATASGGNVLVTADELGIAFELEVTGGTGMTSSTTTGTSELVRYQRDTYEVTVTVTAFVTQGEVTPRHARDASIITRRLRTRIMRPQHHLTLDTAGCPIRRRGTLRDLSARLKSTQQSISALDLVVGSAAIDTESVGWIETAAGEGTLTVVEGVAVDPDDPIAVVPWTATSSES